MIGWAFVLIAVGVGALLDVSLWPGVLIAIGVSVLLPIAFRGNRETARWFDCWPCWPNYSRTGRDDPPSSRLE